MKKAIQTSILVILILLVSMVPWPTVQAIVPDSQTISIIDTHDDKFITEAGVGIDAWLCHILDPTMDIRSYLVFRELEINYWEPLENATLRFRTTANLDFEADSSVTIYGMRYSDLQEISIVQPDFVLSVPLTSASVTVNTSQFYGQQWHEVNVTSIVEELIRSYEWDGDGHAGTETGDAIGFVILGAEGYDTRWFIDYHYGTPSLASQLVIHWNHEPPPPTGSGGLATFNETYRGYHIWNVLSEWLNYSTFTLTNPDANIQNLNDTYFEYTTYYEDEDDYLRKDFSSIGEMNRKFGITYLVFKDNTVAETGPIILHWGIANITSSPWGPPYWGEGYSIHTLQSAGGSLEKLQIINWVNGVHDTHVDLHPYWADTSLPITIWVDVNLNLDTGVYNVTLYNDMEMTSVNQSTAGTFGSVPDASLISTEFAMGPTISASANRDWESGLRLSSPETGDSWTVTDENGTTIADDLDDYDDAIIVIEDELGADPEDPDPPGEEWSEGPGGETGAFTRFRMRLWFLLIGFGCLFGPVLFFAWRRPSGYYILCGAIVMLMGIGMLLSIGQV